MIEINAPEKWRQAIRKADDAIYLELAQLDLARHLQWLATAGLRLADEFMHIKSESPGLGPSLTPDEDEAEAAPGQGSDEDLCSW